MTNVHYSVTLMAFTPQAGSIVSEDVSIRSLTEELIAIQGRIGRGTNVAAELASATAQLAALKAFAFNHSCTSTPGVTVVELSDAKAEVFYDLLDVIVENVGKVVNASVRHIPTQEKSAAQSSVPRQFPRESIWLRLLRWVWSAVMGTSPARTPQTTAPKSAKPTREQASAMLAMACNAAAGNTFATSQQVYLQEVIYHSLSAELLQSLGVTRNTEKMFKLAEELAAFFKTARISKATVLQFAT
jgi:hypothetical protein